MKSLVLFLALMLLPLPVFAAGEARKVETQKIVVAPAPEIHRGTDGLPPRVAAMRQRILDAAYSGDMAKLKVVIQQSETPPVFAVNEVGDPIAYLKSQSGDGDGLEMLAVLTDVLESGWTRTDVGKAGEMYVWPYFVTQDMSKLTETQKVELFKVVASADFEEMKATGIYTFYALGIGPDGTWHYFKVND